MGFLSPPAPAESADSDLEAFQFPDEGFLRIGNTLPILLVLIYLTLGSLDLTSPGLHYNEFAAGTSSSGIDATFKEFLYGAIFKWFGPSYFSIRIPRIFLTAIALAFVYELARRWIGKSAAWSTLALLAVDPSFIALTRTDFGPVVLNFLLRSAALLWIWSYFEGRSRIALAGAAAALWAGFHNNADFAWFGVSSMASSAIIYWDSFRLRTPRDLFSSKFRIGCAAVAAVFAAVVLRQMVLFGAFRDLRIPSLDHAATVARNLVQLLDGFGFYEMALGPSGSGQYLGGILWGIVAGGSVVRFRGKQGGVRRFHLWLLLTVGLVIVQILFSGRATATWHVFMIYPMVTLLLASSLLALSGLLWKREWIRGLSVTPPVLVICILHLGTYSEYIRAYQAPTANPEWSRKIGNVLAYTQSVPNRFVSADWGVHNQLRVLSGAPEKYVELAALLNRPLSAEQEEAFAAEYLRRENGYMFILHGPDLTFLRAARQQLFALAARHDRPLRRVQAVSEGGRVLFEIFK